MESVIKGDWEMVKGELISSIDLTLARKISEQKAKKLKSIPFKESNEEIYIYSNIYEKSLVEEFEFIFRKKLPKTKIGKVDFRKLESDIGSDDE